MNPSDMKDWEAASIADLQKLKAKLSYYIDDRFKAKKQEALNQIKQITVEHQLSYEEVVAAIRTTALRGKAPSLYRNPQSPRQTWSGNGSPPDWFTNHPEPESLRIPGS